MTNRFASRKFIVSLAALASATGLVAAGCIADGVYATVVVATVGGYLTANVMQKPTAKEPAP